MADEEAERQRKLGRDPNMIKDEEKRRMQQENAILEMKRRIQALQDEINHEEERIRFAREERYQEYLEWKSHIQKITADRDEELEAMEEDEQNRQRKLFEVYTFKKTSRLEELKIEKTRLTRMIGEEREYNSRQKEIEQIEKQLEKKYDDQRKVRENQELKRREDLARQNKNDELTSAERARQRIKEENIEAERLRLLKAQNEQNGAMFDDDRLRTLYRLEDEERERMRLKRLGEDEAEFLARRLVTLETNHKWDRNNLY